MKILGVWNHKGGVGKTTLALNLAASLACGAAKRRVVVTDEDEQGSAHKWAEAGKLPFEVTSGPPDNPEEVDFWIVDYKAGFKDLPGMQHILIPTSSSAVDVREFTDAAATAVGGNKSIIYIHNKVVEAVSYDKENKRLLSQLGAMKVHHNACFGAAEEMSTTIYDKAVKNGKPSQSRGQLDLIAGALWQMIPDVNVDELEATAA